MLAATSGDKSAEDEEGALVAVLTWLRFSSSRLLTWNKNYNIKPREISAAQVSLCSLVNVYACTLNICICVL